MIIVRESELTFYIRVPLQNKSGILIFTSGKIKQTNGNYVHFTDLSAVFHVMVHFGLCAFEYQAL